MTTFLFLQVVMARRKKDGETPAWYAWYALVALFGLGTGLKGAIEAQPRRAPTMVYMLPSTSGRMNADETGGVAAPGPYDLTWTPFDFEKDDQHFEDVFWQQQLYDTGDQEGLELLEDAVVRKQVCGMHKHYYLFSIFEIYN